MRGAASASGNGGDIGSRGRRGLVAGADRCGDRRVRSLFTIGFGAFVLALVSMARADFADDLARIHLEVVGGNKSLLSLKSMRATGVTKIQGKDLRFVMWAARPNLIRTETTSNGRVLTQGYDGVNPPWVLDSQTGVVTEMGPVAARAIDEDADFDDPLVLLGKRRISVDYAGETEIDGKPVFKLLVTQNFTVTFSLYLDCSSYLIIRRDMVKEGVRGPETVVTEYGDFGALNGVTLPYRIVEKVDGQVRHETVLSRIDANPPIMPGLFSKPVATVKP